MTPPTDADSSTLHRRWASRLSPLVSAGALLAILVLLVFGDFVDGRSSPQFDFVGAYNAEAFAWWTDGSFFRPPEWMPYTWSGYPTAASLQNSAWYLPVGILANLTFFDIQAASLLYVLHVAFGAVGTYVLARRMGLGHLAALLGLAASFFVAGYFANAQHVDIVRGYAWTPWFLLVLSPWWPWKRWWSVAAAALVIWQILLGTYPGMLVAMFYIGVVWILALQVSTRRPLLHYLVPLGVSATLAVLLSLVKFLPAIALQGGDSPSGVNDSAFDLGILGTFFFAYYGENLPTDMSMRPYFVPAAILALLALVPWRSAIARSVIVVVILAAAISIPHLPWEDLVAYLPGAGLSRFRSSDYRPFILYGLILLAMMALDAASRPSTGPRVRRWWVVGYEGALLAFALWLAGQSFDRPLWVAPFVLLTLSAMLVPVLAEALPEGGPRVGPGFLSVALIALTVASGTTWAFATTRPWRADRLTVEIQTWGTTVDSLILARFDPDTAATSAWRPQVQRPARTPLDQEPVGPIESQRLWNASYFSGVAAVGGYTNLKGNPSFEAQTEAFADPAISRVARAFYAAPGTAVARSGEDGPRVQDIADCLATDLTRCGTGLRLEPVHYEPGIFRYRVSAASPLTLDLNESWYPGWTAELCSAEGSECRPVTPTMGSLGNIAIEVPSGEWTLGLRYVTPYRATGWILFGVGAGLTLLWTAGAGLMVLRRRSAPGNDPAAGPPAPSTIDPER